MPSIPGMPDTASRNLSHKKVQAGTSPAKLPNNPAQFAALNIEVHATQRMDDGFS